MARRDPQALAASIREAGLPDSLNRMIGMTAEQLEAYEKRIRRITARATERKIKNPHDVKRPTGLGVPLGFLRTDGATLKATTEGDTTMAKKTKATAARGLHPAIKSVSSSGHKTTKVATAPKSAGGKVSKADELAKFISRAGGRSIDAICNEFGWQKHSARAAISGLGKSVKDGGKGLTITRTENADGVSVYAIAAA